MSTKRIPDFYPNDGPLNWADDTSGKMQDAMLTYFEPGSTRKEITPEQLELVREYGEYYLDAPCWDANPAHTAETRAQLAALRAQIKAAKTIADIDTWVAACLDIGIDPY